MLPKILLNIYLKWVGKFCMLDPPASLRAWLRTVRLRRAAKITPPGEGLRWRAEKARSDFFCYLIDVSWLLLFSVGKKSNAVITHRTGAQRSAQLAERPRVTFN